MGFAWGLLFVSLLSESGRPPPAAETHFEEVEAKLFGGEFVDAQARLAAFEPRSTRERERRARLAFDLSVAAVDRHEAERWARELSGNTGWEPYVVAGLARLERRASRLAWSRAGVFSFAVALGILLMGGGRELLRPGRAGLIAGLGGVLGLALVLPESPGLGLRLGMTVIAGTSLVHAAEAALARHAAGPKWRLLVATAVVLGTAGVGLTAFLPEGPA